MNDRNNANLDFPEQVCPKRPWVMATLSDDEALGPKGDLPTGLAFHLRQCDSCRAVADSLQQVTSELGRLASAGVADALGRRGTARVEQALRDGARLTGRFVAPDKEGSALPDGRFRLNTLRWPLSAAAILLLGVGVASWFNTSHDQPKPAVTVSGEPVWPFDDDVFGDVPKAHSTDGLRGRGVASHDAGPDDPNAPAIDTSTVASGSPARRHRRTRPTIVWYSSHIDAAMNDTPGAVQAAVVMPRRRAPDEGASWRDLFDRSGGFLFTTSPRETK